MNMTRTKCPVCNCASKTDLVVCNWMFNNSSLKKEYIYCICDECGCIYRSDMDIDYSLLYNDDYGASSNDEKIANPVKRSFFRTQMKKLRDSYPYMNKHRIIGRFLSAKYPESYPFIREYKELLGQGKTFIDIGCRDGSMIYELKDSGVNACGTEPYISEPILYPNGAIVYTKFIYQLEEKYDIAFYNNVFEHIDDPDMELEYAYSALNDNGLLGLLFPGRGKMFDEYKENTFTLQAPQHSILHTRKSVEVLALKHGFEIVKILRCNEKNWYIKSQLLKERIPFREGEEIDCLKNKISDYKEDFPDCSLDDEGDLYHVILKKISR